ncbi:hypothetical protein [Nonomuraea basaltis]|uniref:hypothetical protein n=1 Tax=Nonomuraea basaltis TaxID=2495887 RepID=UPI00110C537F|nr:hypothetical protein [Nonomuraea basaltis]TMR93865.1 hypothetical protein EJK15_36990 [Nonomuraea basaltis]
MTFFPSRRLRGAALVLACAAFCVLPASPAYAHDALKRSSPAKNAEVSALVALGAFVLIRTVRRGAGPGGNGC